MEDVPISIPKDFLGIISKGVHNIKYIISYTRATAKGEEEDLSSSPLMKRTMWAKVKNFILDLLYPQFCFNCGQEGSYLCEDCQSILGVLNTHQKYTTHPSVGGLKDLYFALPYQETLIKNLIQKFKYQPFVKGLAISLTSLIITHFQLLDNKPNFSGFTLIPVPLEKSKLKRRGFNQAEEIGKELARFLKIPLIPDCLVKIRETLPQVELSDQERKENVKDAFSINPVRCSLSNGVDKKILLVDDIYTTGSTLEECAKVLKKAGAKEIIGIVVARAESGKDQLQNV